MLCSKITVDHGQAKERLCEGEGWSVREKRVKQGRGYVRGGDCTSERGCVSRQACTWKRLHEGEGRARQGRGM